MTKVVGFYTEGTDYEHEAQLLMQSLERVGMVYVIKPIRDHGDWNANTAQKAVVLRDFRDEMDGPLLYIDVDAYVHENCTDYFDDLARQGYDFGAHWFRGPSKGHDRSKVRDEGWWMLSGTLFLGDTSGCQHLLDAWSVMNEALRSMGLPQGGGQKNLWFLLTAHFKHLHVARFPGRYTYVFDKPWGYPDGEPCIIEHTIGSREHRDRDVPEPNAKRQARLAELWQEVGR